jgi:hypothetical protein
VRVVVGRTEFVNDRVVIEEHARRLRPDPLMEKLGAIESILGTETGQWPPDPEQTRLLAYELYERNLRTGTINRTQPPPQSGREIPPSAER